MSKYSLRSIIFNFLYPLTRLVGDLHIGPRYRKVKYASALQAYGLVRPGDVICTRANGEFTNCFIKGSFKHSGIFANGFVTEATREGVHKMDFFDFLMSKDSFVIMRPLFEFDESKLGYLCQSYVGLPYDYFFSPTLDAFTCAELVGHVLAESASQQIPFTKRKILGVYTIHPDDFFQALDKFRRMI